MIIEPTRPTEIAALANALHAVGSVRIPLGQIWTLWTAAAPRLVGHPAQAAALATALRELATTGTIELPVNAWDASTVPPPDSVI